MHWGRGEKEQSYKWKRKRYNKNTINDFPLMDYILLFFEIDVEISRIDFFFLLSYYLFVQNIYFIDDNRLNNNVTSNEYSSLSLYHYWHLILASFQKKKKNSYLVNRFVNTEWSKNWTRASPWYTARKIGID